MKIGLINFVIVPCHQETGLDIKKQRPVFSLMMEPECAEDVIVVADPWNTVTNIPILQGTNQYEALLNLVGKSVGLTSLIYCIGRG